jgi:hypothetical protein
MNRPLSNGDQFLVVRAPRDGTALPLAFDLVRIFDEFIDDTDRVFAGVLLAEIVDEWRAICCEHQIINLKHRQLAGKIDWDFIDGWIAPLYVATQM